MNKWKNTLKKWNETTPLSEKKVKISPIDENKDIDSKENIQWEPQNVYLEKKNNTSEMLAYIPKIKEIATSLKKDYWIENIIYDAKQRLAEWSKHYVESHSYFEQSYEQSYIHLSIIEKEIKKYPKGILLPKNLILSAQLIKKDTLSTYINNLNWTNLISAINSTIWFYAHWWDHKESIYLASWKETQYSPSKISWTFHHEILHLQDHEYDWIDEDRFPDWPYITEYSYKNTNESQAELAKFLYNDMAHLLKTAQTQLQFWKSSILEQITMMTWFLIDIDLVKSWERKNATNVFLSKMPEEQYKKRYYAHAWYEFYAKRAKDVDSNHWNNLLKESIDVRYELTDREMESRNESHARIFFDEYSKKIKNEWKEIIWEYWDTVNTEKLIDLIDRIHKKEFIIEHSDSNKKYSIQNFLRKDMYWANSWIISRIQAIYNGVSMIDDHKILMETVKKIENKIWKQQFSEERKSIESTIVNYEIKDEINYTLKKDLNKYYDKYNWSLVPHLAATFLDEIYIKISQLHDLNENWINNFLITALTKESSPYLYNEEIFSLIYDYNWIRNELPKDVTNKRKKDKQRDTTIKYFEPNLTLNNWIDDWELFIIPLDYLRYKAKKEWNKDLIKYFTTQ